MTCPACSFAGRALVVSSLVMLDNKGNISFNRRGFLPIRSNPESCKAQTPALCFREPKGKRNDLSMSGPSTNEPAAAAYKAQKHCSAAAAHTHRHKAPATGKP